MGQELVTTMVSISNEIATAAESLVEKADKVIEE